MHLTGRARAWWVAGLLVVGLGCLGHAAPALGAAQRSFVSAKGADSGGCTPTTPCRTFDYAMTQTSTGGEVVALDSGGYGAIYITKEITLTAARGVHAAISPSWVAAAIYVNAPAGADVELKHLRLRRNSGVSDGVYIAAGDVSMDDLKVSGFYWGVENFGGDLTVTDTSVSGGTYGIQSQGSQSGSTRQRVVVKDSQFRKNFIALRGFDHIGVSVSGSVFSANDLAIVASVFSGAPNVHALVGVDSSVIVNNGIGVRALNTGTDPTSFPAIVVGRSSIERNTCAFEGAVYSYGDNSIQENEGCSTPPAGTYPRL